MEDELSARISRLFPNGRGVWIPMDHGISSYPEKGLDKMDTVIDSIIAGGADAIVCQKGVLTSQYSRTNWDGFVCHLSVSTVHGGSNSQNKIKVGTAKEALSRGAVGVSGQVNLGDKNEPEMILDMGELTSEAHDEKMPVLGMIYPRGPNLVNIPGDLTNGIAHAARVAYELGCHAVKVPWTGSAEIFRDVCSAVPIPVLIAGGTSSGDFVETLHVVEAAISAGASGVCMGRQVFGAEDPERCVKALRAIIHHGKNAIEAWEV
ncbi:MAG: 2-amino-3,7-dideoxy-D-threo-hept-6-ulosonate synthase [Candidatus Thalassarchaeaceae archaeon]|nr:2-amino-3,7-dideoxy-D-threo-hept-6-ulosonate synthase [Candidatus Thalassarchaeaceae archaeon]